MLQPGEATPTIHARPVFGLPVCLPDDLRRGPVALAFVGPLESPLAREALDELQARWAELDLLGVRLVAISPTTTALAQDYVTRHQLLFPLVLDPERGLAWSFGVADDLAVGAAVGSMGPGRVRRVIRALGRGGLARRAPFGARVALVLLGRDGRVRWTSQAESPVDGPDLAGLLAAVRAVE